MERSRMRPSLRAYNALLRSHASKRNFGESTQLLLKMRQASLMPDATSITAVMRSVLGVAGGSRLVEHFLPELQRLNHPAHDIPASSAGPSASYFVAMQGRSNKAASLALVSSNMVIGTMSKDPLGKEGGLSRLQAMLARGEEVSAQTFASVLQGYAKAPSESSRWREAMQVVGMLEGWLKQRNTVVEEDQAQHNDLVNSAFAAAISACAKGGRTDRAIETLERMERLGIPLSVKVGPKHRRDAGGAAIPAARYRLTYRV